MHVKSLQRKVYPWEYLILTVARVSCISDRLARIAESRAWQKDRLPPLQVVVALFTFDLSA